ncbi:hypothetical protein AB3S75_034961 [Citrus x aurantiifolia]
MANELGAEIGKVEEIETDAAGECFGEFFTLRILVDITKPLKKIIELEQEGDDEDDIPMRVMYERLPDFCFCCGRIGHQYRECTHYKSQSKDKMAYGPWLKATSIAERLKQNRQRDRWESEASKGHTSSSMPMKDVGWVKWGVLKKKTRSIKIRAWIAWRGKWVRFRKGVRRN